MRRKLDKMGDREFKQPTTAFGRNTFRLTVYKRGPTYPPRVARGSARAWPPGAIPGVGQVHELVEGWKLPALVFWNQYLAPLNDELAEVLISTGLRVAVFGPENEQVWGPPKKGKAAAAANRKLPMNPMWHALSFINTKSGVPVVAFPFSFSFWRDDNGKFYLRDETQYLKGEIFSHESESRIC